MNYQMDNVIFRGSSFLDVDLELSTTIFFHDSLFRYIDGKFTLCSFYIFIMF
jgi:hypothetical protein